MSNIMHESCDHTIIILCHHANVVAIKQNNGVLVGLLLDIKTSKAIVFVLWV